MVTYSDLFQFCILIHSQKSTKLEHIGIQITHCFSYRQKRSDRRHPDKYGDHFKALLRG